ncbi:MAG: DUF3422 family protein [Rubrivivax sp.]|nr:MAG: DUF3422 family protein [Rubrivivax sp.]
MTPAAEPGSRVLPPDDLLREDLHNEVHARPSARIHLPALVVLVAVLNEGVGREQECEHLRRLPGQDGLTPEQLRGNFLRLRFDAFTLKWERHTEFTRYSIVQPLPAGCGLGTCDRRTSVALAPSARPAPGVSARAARPAASQAGWPPPCGPESRRASRPG